MEKDLWTMTPLFEHPKWKLWIYSKLKWPKKWKPTGFKGFPPMTLEAFKEPYIMDATEYKWEIEVPHKGEYKIGIDEPS